MTPIHPTAIVESGACLAADVKVGPYAYIGPQVIIGSGTIIHHHATIEGHTELGERNEIYPYAYIGGKSQDQKFKGGKTCLKIGHDNIFREYVSIHLGNYTAIGSHNLFLAYSHVAHDCQVGNFLIMSSHAALGGHVQLGDRVNIGWSSGVHQFCTVGDHAMVGACSKVVQDVPPFVMVDGNSATARTINKIGMERAKYTAQEIETAKKAFKILYRKKLHRKHAIEQLNKMQLQAPSIIEPLLTFMGKSTRGLA